MSRRLLLHPVFLLGLALRLILIAFVSPQAVSDWYAPFLDVSTQALTLDPWSTWLAHDGSLLAFPYGFVMWLAFLPLTVLAQLANLPVSLAYSLTLLIADVAMLYLLNRFFPGRLKTLLVVYWLSPIVIFPTYMLGLNDLIPVLILTIALHCLGKTQVTGAGISFAAAISAKLSMVLALPFVLIYLFNNRPLRPYFVRFLGVFLASAALFGVTYLHSLAGMRMLFSNPEMAKVYQLSIALGSGTVIYIVPLVYMLMVYVGWRMRRLNIEMFHALLGMVYLLIALTSMAPPGWFLWSVPFLVSYQINGERNTPFIVGAFSGLFLLSAILTAHLRFVGGLEIDPAALIANWHSFGQTANSLMHTMMVASGLVLASKIWQDAIGRNDFFRLSRKAFVIGVAGDSGAGKDTYADAILGLFGAHSVVKLSGDDYHLWDRQKPMWQVMTHLNPRANDLEGFSNDLVALVDGRTVLSRHYDHTTGRMSKPQLIKSRDFIVASGLHALYLPILRECCDLKVYLDIDEGLRRHFKMQRDVTVRGHSVERVNRSFEQREPDAERFIRPQTQHADLILSLQPIRPDLLRETHDDEPVRLKLVVRTRHRFNELSLTRVLVGVCGLHIDVEPAGDGSEAIMTIEGEASSEDIALAARILCPRMIEFMDISPRWSGGMTGLMQLVTLSHISQALTKRFI